MLLREGNVPLHQQPIAKPQLRGIFVPFAEVRADIISQPRLVASETPEALGIALQIDIGIEMMVAGNAAPCTIAAFGHCAVKVMDGVILYVTDVAFQPRCPVSPRFDLADVGVRAFADFPMTVRYANHCCRHVPVSRPEDAGIEKPTRL